jgi:hypothetical protein
MRWRFLIAASLALGSAGCAVHPLTNDFVSAKVGTTSIVRHIRCEARSGFTLAIADYFRTLKYHPPTVAIGDKLRSREIKLNELGKYFRRIDADAVSNIEKYAGTAVGYDFTFDMTEDNGLSADFDLLRVISRGTTGFGLTAGSAFQRQTVRVFRVADSLQELMTMTEDDCPFDDSVDLVHPVKGNIGLAEMVKTFVDLNEFERLTGKSDPVPVLSDTFNFTTTLSASANPVITLSPVRRLGIAEGGITLSGARKDNHKVIVAMSLPVKKRAAGRGVTGFVGGASRTAAPVTTAADRVDKALDDQINRSIVNQLSIPR